MAAPPAAFVPLGARIGTRQKRLLLSALMMALFVTSLNQQIIATAMPRILAELGGFSLLSWVFTTYMLTSTIATPIVGKLSDMFGRRRFMLTGIVVFVVASGVAGFSTSMPMLIAARAVQGVGGGTMLAVHFATLGDLFPPAERGKYTALFIGVATASQLAGPTVGGLITDSVGWRWCFFVSMPMAAAAFFSVARYLPGAVARTEHPRIDIVGAALLSGLSSAFLLALVWAQRAYGWAGSPTVLLFAAAAVLLVLFLLQERRHPEAIVPLHLFRQREFGIGAITVTLVGAGSFGAITYLPTFVQTAMGASATASGLVTTPQAIGSLAGSFVAGQVLAMSGRYRWQVFVGLGFMLVGNLLLQSLGIGDPRWHVSVFMIVLGLGSGATQTTMTVVILNAVDPRFMGVAAACRQFFQQLGGVVSVAVFGLVLSSTYQSSFAARLPAETRAVVPASVLTQFADPTMPLDQKRFTPVQAEVRALPDGNALLDTTLTASRHAVGAANRAIFQVASLMLFGAVLVAFALREATLRRTFEPAADAGLADAAPRAGPVEPAAATRQRAEM